MINVAVDRTASPPGGYSQYIPAKDSGIGFHRIGPPLLPPHLLDTVLNKDMPVSVRLIFLDVMNCMFVLYTVGLEICCLFNLIQVEET